MKHRFNLVLILAFVFATLSQAVFAKGEQIVEVRVRNLTKQTIELAYKGADGVQHWAHVPAGISSLTLPEGVYSYWADPACGHVAGTINFNKANTHLWVQCGAKGGRLVFSEGNKPAPASGCADEGVFVNINNPSAPIIEFYSKTNWDDPSNAYEQIEIFLVANFGGIVGCSTDMTYDFYSLHY